MTENSDWRLQGHEDYLHGLTLKHRRYRATATNDHDHCELCFVKFMDADYPDVLREGYATPDGYFNPYWFLRARRRYIHASERTESGAHEFAAGGCGKCRAGDYGATRPCKYSCRRSV